MGLHVWLMLLLMVAAQLTFYAVHWQCYCVGLIHFHRCAAVALVRAWALARAQSPLPFRFRSAASSTSSVLAQRFGITLQRFGIALRCCSRTGSISPKRRWPPSPGTSSQPSSGRSSGPPTYALMPHCTALHCTLLHSTIQLVYSLTTLPVHSASTLLVTLRYFTSLLILRPAHPSL